MPGCTPKEGRNAIAAAARAIADLRLGRVDDISTANVGEIHGGVAANIVAEHCTFVAEARSHDERRLADLVQEMLEPPLRGRDERVRRADVEARRLPRLPLQARRRGGSRRDGRTRSSRARAVSYAFPAAGPTRTSSTCAGCLPQSRERHGGDPHARRSTSPSPTSRGWSRSRSRCSTRRVALSLRRGTVTAVLGAARRPRARSRSTACRASPTHDVTGPVALGDEVLVNTQARDLGLGSGGFDVLYVNLTRGLGLAAERDAHVMQLPYTPLQHAVRARRGVRARSPDACWTGCPSSAVRCTARLRRSARRCRAPRRLRPARRRSAAPRALGHTPGSEERRLLELTVGVGAMLRGRLAVRRPSVRAALHAGRRGFEVAVCAIGPGIVGTGSASATAVSRRSRPRTRRRPWAAGRSLPFGRLGCGSP